MERLKIIARLEDQVRFIAAALNIDYVHLVVEEVKEDAIAQLRAFYPFRHLYFKVSPDAVNLRLHSHPLERARFFVTPFQLKRLSEISERERCCVFRLI